MTAYDEISRALTIVNLWGADRWVIDTEDWDAEDPMSAVHVLPEGASVEDTVCEVWHGNQVGPDVAAFIAACSPYNMAEILYELETLREKVARNSDEMYQPVTEVLYRRKGD